MTPNDPDTDGRRPRLHQARRGPAAAPTPQQLETARKEAASGGAELRKAGYYVAIARRAAARVPPRNGVRHALLVVEDDPDLSKLLAEIFSVAGFEVRRAAQPRADQRRDEQAHPSRT